VANRGDAEGSHEPRLFPAVKQNGYDVPVNSERWMVTVWCAALSLGVIVGIAVYAVVVS